MMRTAVPRASQLGKKELGCAAHQRRSKTFVKKVDKNDQVYYKLAKRGLAHNPDPSKEHEFFEMPNLLLDLDADGIRGVRAFEEADEKPMTAKWTEVPRREAVRARLKKLESQIEDSQAKVSAIASDPTNIWRINPHDIFSAALHGAVPDTLRRENGIPLHAIDSDESLLNWLLLRQRATHKSTVKQGKEGSATTEDLVKALQNQDSVLGIRRLVFQCIRGGTDLSGFQTPSPTESDLPLHIRAACERVLQACPSNIDLRRQTLTFLGNLSERLARLEYHIGTSLGGLALRLAAETGSVAATSEWLYRASADLETKGSHIRGDDLLSALTALEHGLDLQLANVHSRQLLFQTLTGIDENSTIMGPISLRSTIQTLALNGNSVAFATYALYISLLGRLGATHTLWREWREPLAANAKKMCSQDEMESVYLQALKHASIVMCLGNDEPLGSASLEDCLRIDHHAIETHHAATMQTDASHTMVNEDPAQCRAMFALPIEEFASLVQSWRSKK